MNIATILRPTGPTPNKTRVHRPRLAALLCACAALLSVAIATADDDRGRGRDRSHAVRYFDERHHHDRYYPPRGVVFARPPRGNIIVNYRDRRYFYGGGIWYAPRGPRFVVIAPPIGAFVSVLPDFYTTVWFGGLPYFYANQTYYVWRERRGAYEVVEPPRDAEAASESPPSDDLYIYPRNGQDSAQQARDRYECHRWAVDQTGFDPTRPGGGVPENESGARRAQYFRAMTACLEGRGYTVR